MGIYDKNKKNQLKLSEFKTPFMAAVAVIIILLAFWFVGTLFEPRVMRPSFKYSPWSLSDSNSNILSVRVTDIYKEDSRNAVVSVSSIDPKSISVYPESQAISTLGAGDSRVLNFVLLPVAKNGVNAGTYSFAISVAMNGKMSEMRTSIEVQS
ncbi:MAG: hypothetical protein WC602_06350 [archaeon]